MTSVIPSLRKIALAVVGAASSGDIDNVLLEIAKTARELINTRYAALGIPSGHGSLSHFLTSGMAEAEIALLEHPPIGVGLLGVIMNERIALRIDDIALDARRSGFPRNHPKMKTLLGVPIQISDHLFGMLYLSDKVNGEPFNEEDQALVETLAGYAALAIGGVELSNAQMRLSLLEERERIGMELHDSIIQLLYAVGMELQLLKSDIKQPKKLNSPIHHLDEVIAEVRRYIMTLQSAERRRLTIRQGLHDTIDKLHPPPTLSVVINAPDEYPPFDSPTFVSLLHICSEVVSNAIRHAHANKLYIEAVRDAGMFTLLVQDNGSGFHPEEITPGLGLANIQRRAQLHNGIVELSSVVGQGTSVRVSIPTV